MPVIFLISLFFYCVAIPLGIYLAVLSYRIGKKISNPHIILEMPFEEKEAFFHIEESGRYSVWHRGKLYSRPPVDKFMPRITNLDINEDVKLFPSILRPKITGSSMGSMELFNFKAIAGNYKLEIVDGSSISSLEKIFLSPLSKVFNSDLDKYSLLVRKRQNPFQIFGFVWLIILSILLIVGGLVMGLVADKVFVF